VLRSKKEELLVTIFAGVILLIIASSLMYYVERDAQPEAFKSILSSMWWGVATLTTIGYGDIYPITALGRFLGSLIAVMGIGLFALPAGIVASGFATELQNKARHPHICPHCGKDIDAAPHSAHEG
jgi:voltage-gated potassium channel